MALTAFPMESNYGGVDVYGNPIYDRAVGSVFYRTFWSKYFTDGIFFEPADSFKVTPAGGMAISIKLGECHIRGVTASPDDETVIELVLDDSSAAADRTDRIVLRADFEGTRAVYAAVRADWKSADRLTRNANVWELALADVLIKAGAKEISSANITDLRLNTELCGVVTEPITRTNTQVFFDELTAERQRANSEWNEQKLRQESDWRAQLDAQDDNFEELDLKIQTWFAAVRHNIVKLQTFSFDNLAALAEAAKKTVFSGNTTTETVRNPLNQNKIAERITTFSGDGKTITEATTVYDTDGVSVLKQATITTKFNTDGSISDDAVGFDDYTLNAGYVGEIEQV